MAAPQLTRHRFTVDEYHQMAAAGIFWEDDRVELIEGEIVDMPPVGGPHIGTINRLNRLFNRGLDDVIVQVQSPIRLGEHSEPQPDLVLLRPETTTLPAWPEDVRLVIEVSDSTLRYDRDVKAPLYARAGIPEFWVVALARKAILVYRTPSPAGYQTVLTVRGDEPISPQAFPDFTLTARQILG